MGGAFVRKWRPEEVVKPKCFCTWLNKRKQLWKCTEYVGRLKKMSSFNRVLFVQISLSLYSLSLVIRLFFLPGVGRTSFTWEFSPAFWEREKGKSEQTCACCFHEPLAQDNSSSGIFWDGRFFHCVIKIVINLPSSWEHYYLWESQQHDSKRIQCVPLFCGMNYGHNKRKVTKSSLSLRMFSWEKNLKV